MEVLKTKEEMADHLGLTMEIMVKMVIWVSVEMVQTTPVIIEDQVEVEVVATTAVVVADLTVINTTH